MRRFATYSLARWQALGSPGRRAELLQEAARLMDGLGPEARAMHDDVRVWRAWVHQAQQDAVPRSAVTRLEGSSG